MLLDHLGLMEERNEWLVSRLDEHELKRVVIEGDALKSLEDGTQGSTTSNCDVHVNCMKGI